MGLQLSQEDMDVIETGYTFEIGFPHNFVRGQNKAPRGPEDIVFTARSGHFDYVEQPQPIQAYSEIAGSEQRGNI